MSSVDAYYVRAPQWPLSQGGPVQSSGFLPMPKNSYLSLTSFCCRSWCPCEIALSASETVASATSKESHDLYACRGARSLPGILRSPEEWPAGRGPAPPHGPAVPDPAPAAVWQPRPASPLHHRVPSHAPLGLQDDRRAEQNAGHYHAEAGKVIGGWGEGWRGEFGWRGGRRNIGDLTLTRRCEDQGKGSSHWGKKFEGKIRPKSKSQKKYGRKK